MSEDASDSLCRAVQNGDLETVTNLINSLSLCSSEKITNANKEHLLCEALKHRHGDIAKLLILNGFYDDINLRWIAGSPLNLAMRNDDSETIETFLSRHADITAEDETGRVLLGYAVCKNSLEIIRILLTRNVNVNDTLCNYPERLPLFHTAAKHGHLQIVEYLLNRGAHVNSVCNGYMNFEGFTPLHMAAYHGHPQVVEYLLNHGASVEGISRLGITPLHCACQHGNEDVVKILLSKGAAVNPYVDGESARYSTPLYDAIAYHMGYPKIVKMLLQRGADVDFEGTDGCPTLCAAISCDNVEMVEDILKARPKISAKGNRICLKEAINRSYRNEEGREIVRKILQYGCTVTSEDAADYQFLRVAVSNGNLEVVEQVLKFCGDVATAELNSKYKDRNQPLLSVALQNKHLDVAKVLIKYGADVNAVPWPDPYSNGSPLIIEAIKENDVNSLELLLNNGINIKDYPDLLHTAVKVGDVGTVEFLSQHSVVDINQIDKFGRVALHYTAVEEEKTPIVRQSRRQVDDIYKVMSEKARILLRNGACVNARCECGKTTLHVAADEGSVEVVKTLLEYNADVNVRAERDVTPLHCCGVGLLYRRYPTANNEIRANIEEMLLNNGADINAKRTDGRTALHIAAKRERLEIVKNLLKYGVSLNSETITDDKPSASDGEQFNPGINETVFTAFVDIDARDKNGKTALHTASKYLRHTIVPVLLGYGSDINLTCNNDLTPLDYVCPKYEWSDSDSEEFSVWCSQTDIINILHKHILKMKAIGRYVSERNLEAVRGPEFDDWCKDCKDEIKKMKNTKLGTDSVSMYDVLTKDVNQLAVYVRNKYIMQALESLDYNEEFKIYSNMIEGNLVKGQKRNILLIPSIKSFNHLFRCGLPDFMAVEVLAYLSNTDLINMMKACSNVVTSKCDI